jgi:hypothetical protein
MSRRCSQHSYLPRVDRLVMLPVAGQLITGRSRRRPPSSSNHGILTVGYLLLVGLFWVCLVVQSFLFGHEFVISLSPLGHVDLRYW